MSGEEEHKAGPEFWLILAACLASITMGILITLNSYAGNPSSSFIMARIHNSSSGRLPNPFFPYSGIDTFLTLTIPLVLLFLVVWWARRDTMHLPGKRR